VSGCGDVGTAFTVGGQLIMPRSAIRSLGIEKNFKKPTSKFSTCNWVVTDNQAAPAAAEAALQGVPKALAGPFGSRNLSANRFVVENIDILPHPLPDLVSLGR